MTMTMTTTTTMTMTMTMTSKEGRKGTGLLLRTLYVQCFDGTLVLVPIIIGLQ